MSSIGKKAFEGLAQFFVAMAACIFVPAWTFAYWQAWVFLAAFFLPVGAITLYLLKHDTKLLERRLNAGPAAEKEKSQRAIQTAASITFVSLFISSALDHRFEWSTVPFWAIIAGNVLVVVGLFIVLLVFKENSFTSATIEIDDDQAIVTTGPYAIVRHPMYAGAVLMLSGIPIALGSLWGYVAVLLISVSIAWRSVEEERFLLKHLEGYATYRKQVRKRLIPYIW